MRARTLCLGLLVLGGLAACTPAGPTHDKAYYAAHGDERASELSACRNDPGRLSKTPNCINAQSADADAAASSFWTVKKPDARVAKPGAL